jgi:predicted GNAT family N-acyltransferase
MIATTQPNQLNHTHGILLNRFTKKEHSFDFRIIKSDDPLIEDVYRFWYSIYIDEMKHPIKEGIDKERKKYIHPINKSTLICAFRNDRIIGTIQLLPENQETLEFPYRKYLQNDSFLIEISKFMIAAEFRDSTLAKLLILKAADYVESVYPNSTAVINCSLSLELYYKRYMFARICEDVFIHPDIQNKSILMKVNSKSMQSYLTRLLAA